MIASRVDGSADLRTFRGAECAGLLITTPSNAGDVVRHGVDAMYKKVSSTPRDARRASSASFVFCYTIWGILEEIARYTVGSAPSGGFDSGFTRSTRMAGCRGCARAFF